ncbi:MAG: hypothetical protein WDA41_08800 [Candidatus Neomarinimicrobiota bacterium]|jgi:hypothetical protein
MGKEQWGHGYHTAIKDMNTVGFVGKWFLSFTEEGKINWQGYILKDEGNGCYLVQLYSWLDGKPTKQIVVKSTDMNTWNFYDTDAQMREDTKKIEPPQSH